MALAAYFVIKSTSLISLASTTKKKSSTQITKIFDGFVGSFKGASIGMLSAPGRGSRGLWGAGKKNSDILLIDNNPGSCSARLSLFIASYAWKTSEHYSCIFSVCGFIITNTAQLNEYKRLIEIRSKQPGL